MSPDCEGFEPAGGKVGKLLGKLPARGGQLACSGVKHACIRLLDASWWPPSSRHIPVNHHRTAGSMERPRGDCPDHCSRSLFSGSLFSGSGLPADAGMLPLPDRIATPYVDGMARTRALRLAGGTIVIPADALEWQFARSAGPGGQHVNRTSSKALLRFTVRNSSWLP